MIDQTVLLTATTKILLDSMSTEDKDKLVGEALKKILTPVKDARGWPYKESSPLDDAFEMAAKKEAHKIVSEYFQTSEVQARLKGLLHDAIEKVFTTEFADKMAHRMVAGLWKEE